MHRYEKNILKQLANGMIQETVKLLLKSVGKEVTKEKFHAIFEAVEEVVNRAINCSAAGSIISTNFIDLQSSRSSLRIL